jgi:hypothetical protein
MIYEVPGQLIGETALGASGAKARELPARSASLRTGARAIQVCPLVGAPRRVIVQLAQQIIICFAPDRSGSMYGTWGDPSDVCGAAAESLIGLQRRSGGGHAAVVPWGTDAPAELVVGPIDVNKGAKYLSSALREHSSLGGNDLGAALRRAAEVTRPLTAEQKLLVFVLTDGIESVTPEIHSAVAALPGGSVHMLLVDRANGCSPQMEADWLTVGFGSFTRLNALNVASMTAELVQIYADALSLHVHTPNRITNRKK